MTDQTLFVSGQLMGLVMTNRLFSIIVAVLLAPPVFACSVSRSYEPFLPGPILRPQSAPTAPPQISVDSIRRGHDGDSGMCADLGFLTLKMPTAAAGYSFEIVEGNLAVVFPQGYIQPTVPGFLGFVWLDGNTDAQEPIRAVVKVTAISVTGTLSEPLLLKIEDSGRVPAR